MGKVQYARFTDYDALKPLLDRGKMVPAQSIVVAVTGEVDLSSVDMTILKNHWGWYSVCHRWGGFEVDDWEEFKTWLERFHVSYFVPRTAEAN